MAGNTRFEAVEGDRRRHLRHPVRHPVVLDMLHSGLRVPCESVDASVGGIRVRSRDPIPLGACDVVVSVDAEDRLALVGSVVETVESPDGASTARIMFLPVLSESADAGRAPAVVVRTPTGRRHRAVLVAAGVAAGLLAVAGAALTGRADEPDDVPTATSDRPPAPSSIPTLVAPLPPATTELPTPATTSAPAPETAAPVTAAPPSAAVSRTERADNLVHVSLGATADDTAVSSFVGPSDGVDAVRVQLNVTPEPVGTALPLEVTIHNRSDRSLAFTDGIRATITATRDGTVVATATFTDADISEVAPGHVVDVGGLFDFGAIGEYDLTLEIVVAESEA